MDRSVVKGIAIGGMAMVALGAGGVTGYRTLTAPRVAEVIAVKEVTEKVVSPRELCEDVQVQRRAPVQDEHRIAGMAIGAVAGGLLGSTVGGGKGKTLATAAGAAAGGYAGNQVQKSMQQNDVVTSTQRRCRTVNDTSQKLVGYDVHLPSRRQGASRAHGEEAGCHAAVRDGKVVTTEPGAPS